MHPIDGVDAAAEDPSIGVRVFTVRLPPPRPHGQAQKEGGYSRVGLGRSLLTDDRAKDHASNRRLDHDCHFGAQPGTNGVVNGVPTIKALHAEAHPFFGATGPGGVDWTGARITLQRRYADPLLNTQDHDRGLGIIFTHDHYGPSTFQQIGLYSTVLVEPIRSNWVKNERPRANVDIVLGCRNGANNTRRPALTNAVNEPPAGCRYDGGPTSWQAVSDTTPSGPNGDVDGDGQNDSFREFYFEYTDFQHAYEAGVYVGAGTLGHQNGQFDEKAYLGFSPALQNLFYPPGLDTLPALINKYTMAACSLSPWAYGTQISIAECVPRSVHTKREPHAIRSEHLPNNLANRAGTIAGLPGGGRSVLLQSIALLGNQNNLYACYYFVFSLRTFLERIKEGYTVLQFIVAELIAGASYDDEQRLQLVAQVGELIANRRWVLLADDLDRLDGPSRELVVAKLATVTSVYFTVTPWMEEDVQELMRRYQYGGEILTVPCFT